MALKSEVKNWGGGRRGLGVIERFYSFHLGIDLRRLKLGVRKSTRSTPEIVKKCRCFRAIGTRRERKRQVQKYVEG